MNKKQILLLFAIAVVTAAGVFSSVLKTQISEDNLQNTTTQNITEQNTPEVANSDVTSDCLVKFTHHFTDINTIDSIIPPIFRNSKGTMSTTLINIKGKAPLYMPAAGKLVQGSYHTEQGAEFYMWEVDAGCGVTFIFDHVTEPVEKIRKLFPSTPRNDTITDLFSTLIEMEAGELVGYTTGSVNAHNWNFAVYKNSEKNYLKEKEEFKNLPKYYTQVCPFKFYDRQMAEVYEKLFIFSFNEISVEINLCGN